MRLRPLSIQKQLDENRKTPSSFTKSVARVPEVLRKDVDPDSLKADGTYELRSPLDTLKLPGANLQDGEDLPKS